MNRQRPKGSTIGLRFHKVGLNPGLLSLPMVIWDTLITETEKRINKLLEGTHFVSPEVPPTKPSLQSITPRALCEHLAQRKNPWLRSQRHRYAVPG